MHIWEINFNEEYEEELVANVVNMSNSWKLLTSKEFSKSAFDLAQQLKLDRRLNSDKKSADKHFYYDYQTQCRNK